MQEKKIKEISFTIIDANYTTTEIMTNKLQELNGKSLQLYQNVSNSFDEKIYRKRSNVFQFEETPLAKYVRVINRTLNKVSLGV